MNIFQSDRWNFKTKLYKTQFTSRYVTLAHINSTMMKTFVFVVLATYFLQATSQSRNCFLNPTYTVYIGNKLPANSAPLTVRCQSKDDDLGNHTIPVGKNYNWSFCNTFLGSTLFFCHFYWGSKEVVFDAFNRTLVSICADQKCYWEAEAVGIFFDGFYPPKKLIKQYDWITKN